MLIANMQFGMKLFLKYYSCLILEKKFDHCLVSLNVSKQKPQKNIKKNKNTTAKNIFPQGAFTNYVFIQGWVGGQKNAKFTT